MRVGRNSFRGALAPRTMSEAAPPAARATGAEIKP
jgi:hypothetical protein